jgi:hypothetical protein
VGVRARALSRKGGRYRAEKISRGRFSFFAVARENRRGNEKKREREFTGSRKRERRKRKEGKERKEREREIDLTLSSVEFSMVGIV